MCLAVRSTPQVVHWEGYSLEISNFCVLYGLSGDDNYKFFSFLLILIYKDNYVCFHCIPGFGLLPLPALFAILFTLSFRVCLL